MNGWVDGCRTPDIAPREAANEEECERGRVQVVRDLGRWPVSPAGAKEGSPEPALSGAEGPTGQPRQGRKNAVDGAVPRPCGAPLSFAQKPAADVVIPSGVTRCGTQPRDLVGEGANACATAPVAPMRSACGGRPMRVAGAPTRSLDFARDDIWAGVDGSWSREQGPPDLWAKLSGAPKRARLLSEVRRATFPWSSGRASWRRGRRRRSGRGRAARRARR